MNVIRLKIPQPISFKGFTVTDYRDLLLVRNDILSNPDEEQVILDEVLEQLYPAYSPLLREYIFINVLLASLGKETVEAQFICPICKDKKNLILHMKQKPLSKPVLVIENLTLAFKYPDKHYDIDQMFLECIETVNDGSKTYKWSDLTDKEKDAVISIISYDKFEEITSQLTMLNVSQTVTCCKQYHVKYKTALEMFKVVVNPEEIFNLYKVNHVLTKHNYTITDLMNMYPFERTIALTMVQQDIKK